MLFTAWGGKRGSALLDLATLEIRRLSHGASVELAASGQLLEFIQPGEVLAGRFDPVAGEAGPIETVVLEGVDENHGDVKKWLAVSETGTLVYVPGDLSERKLVWIDRDGTISTLVDAPGSFLSVALSPDGSTAAVKDLWRIDLLDLRTLTRTPIEQGGASAIYPSWGADGGSLYFSAREGLEWSVRQYSLETATVDLGGASLKAFSQVEQTPAGELVFSSDDTAIDIVKVSSSGEVETLVETAGWDMDPSLSPDGRYMTYSSDFDGRLQIYAKRLSEPGIGVAISADGGRWPRWSPTGDEILFVSGNMLMSAPVREVDDRFEFGVPASLFEVDFAEGYGASRPYDVSADGQRIIAIQRPEGLAPDRLHVVLNWFEELERLVPTK